MRDNKQLNASIALQTALGRVGLPDDIGGAVAALLSDDNQWINGFSVTHPLFWGWMARRAIDIFTL